MRDRFARRAGVVVISAALVAAIALPAMAGGSARTPLGGNVPRWATSANLKGAATGSMTVHVVLGWRNGGALAAVLRSVTTPKSPSYRRFLSPAQFRARYSPSTADVAKVASWLRGQGLRVDAGPASRLWVQATGSVAALQHAFATKINVYRHAGKLLRAPAANPSVPSSLKGIVRGVSGLDDIAATPASPAPPPTSFTVGTPCSVYWSEKIATNKPPAYGVYEPYTPCGYAPDQVQGAYGVAGAIGSGNDGSGVTVAILDAFWQPSLVSDLQTYSTNHGLPAPIISVKKFGPYTDPDENQQGWYGEQSLDTDAVHSMAPGATILYVGAKNNRFGLTNAMAWVLDHHAADLTTNSYGYAGESLPQSKILEQESLWQQAGAEGIGTYFSSGDSGDEIVNLGYRTTDYPASSAWVTAVGGTSLGVGADNSYVFETGWGTSLSSLSHKAWDPAPPGDYLYGGGGGTSRIFGEPWYQYGVVPASLSGYFGGAGRVVPDIGALGDPNTGLTVGETQTFPDGVRYGEFRLGGTSLSCPLIAGIMALAQQRAGGPLGFINPALYAAYSSDSSIVRDIIDPRTTVAVVRTNWVGNDPSSGQKTFSLRTMNTTGTLHTIRGYDDVTGIGTPWGEAYLDAFGG